MDNAKPTYIDAATLEVRFGRERSAFARWTKQRGFPAPLYLGNRRAWLLAEVEAWEREAITSQLPRSAAAIEPFRFQKTQSP